jgi:GMP synthase-like glutamine amidotransferase
MPNTSVKYKILPYVVSDYKVLTPSGYSGFIEAELCEHDLNLLFLIGRVVSVHIRIFNYPYDEWGNLKFLHDPGYRELLKHISTHFFFIGENFVCVPLPGAPFYSPIEESFPTALMQSQYEKATQLNYLTGAFSGTYSSIPLSVSMHKTPSYAIFHMQDYDPWRGLSEALYGGLMAKYSDVIEHYIIPAGHFPSLEVLSNLKGILITGSKYCSFDSSLEWLSPLYELIRFIYHELEIRLVGICLGTQMLARALGGETSISSNQGFIYKLETCEVTYEGREEFNMLGNSYLVAECHRDCVTKLPDDGKIYAKSRSCDIEMWGISGRVLGIQGHPEFNSLFMRHFFNSYIIAKGTITQEQLDQAIISYTHHNTDSETILGIINWFLRWGKKST